ncbi:hypothetical protein HID58_075645 [Brassica napus]|uniref:Uncharacterized protein n=1 Tax=Brassica napus TaxID=3708 RepID=A0ABQ7YK85_BRANA|nr:hypothetical protein HID58_075645 [Brassica napus]
MAMKPNSKSMSPPPNIPPGPHETQLRYRLIHFWEARNPTKRTLTGLEMLLTNLGTVIQGFIPSGRFHKYLPDMKQGSVYRLFTFYGFKSKPCNRFFLILLCHVVPFDEDQFRFHSYENFETNCDLKGDLHDIVGHMKLVNGQNFIEHLIIDEVEIATCCVFWFKCNHMSTHHLSVLLLTPLMLIFCSGPVMKLYFWDQTVTDFCKKFKSYENIPTVLLVTTDNTKCLRGYHFSL